MTIIIQVHDIIEFDYYLDYDNVMLTPSGFNRLLACMEIGALQFLLPSGFNEVPFLEPVLRVLMDCLCFSYDSNTTGFVLWHMKEYGVEESWTQLFKMSYQNLPMLKTDPGFQLACLYVNGDMVIFENKFCNRAFIYNLKDRTVERI
ncbi:hypothetical protein MTR_7g445580 [Medicago truncatula]|uniref:F-box protein interaction domain protein n=1 Tax=Medicago truncatula TaxID=3880 RepID=A0A072U982_MEDTR|nr:hypothetical protein MTR_7g445580 [Medicago truncatula]